MRIRQLGMALVVLIAFLTLVSFPVGASIRLGGEVTVGLEYTIEDEDVGGNLAVDNELLLTVRQQTSSAGLSAGIKVTERVLSLDQAYVDFYRSDLDLRVGKQRIAWGTALNVNPTDVLNPADPSDPLGDKRPVWAAVANYYLDHSWKLTGAILPIFEPAVSSLPNVDVVAPEASWENAEYALKLAALGLNGFDFSVSYFQGKEDYPSVRSTPHGPEGYYDNLRVFGFDAATVYGDLGLWLEGASFQPENKENYAQWIVGADYGLANGLKLIGQYFHLDTGHQQASYLMGAVEKDIGFRHRGRIGLLYNRDTQGWAVLPELTSSLADGLEMAAGARLFNEGAGGLELALLEETNQVYLGFTYSF